MADHLTREQRLRIVAELCPKFGTRRPCDSYDLAREKALEILGRAPSGTGSAPLTADYLLMRAVDQHVAGALSLDDLYRCRVLAYYMVFASGGEEWSRWGVAASIRPGDFPALDETDLDDLLLPPPEGPPWRS